MLGICVVAVKNSLIVSTYSSLLPRDYAVKSANCPLRRFSQFRFLRKLTHSVVWSSISNLLRAADAPRSKARKLVQLVETDLLIVIEKISSREIG